MRRPTSLLRSLADEVADQSRAILDPSESRSILSYIAHLENALTCAEAQVARKTEMLNEAFPAKRRRMTT